MFLFLLRISCHSNVCEKFDFCFTDFRKTIACFCVTHTAQISTRCLIRGNLLGKKTLAKEKYTTQLNSVLFINITKGLPYYILSRYAWNAVLLWIRPPREIYNPIFHLKHLKTGVPIIIIRTAREKLNKEALGKIKNTSKNDRRGCPFLLKFGQ